MLNQQKMKDAREHEKALFDFDAEIDQLEKVEDRYPVVVPSILTHFQVKKTERPNFNAKILEDLAKMRKPLEQEEKPVIEINFHSKPPLPHPVSAKQTFKQMS